MPWRARSTESLHAAALVVDEASAWLSRADAAQTKANVKPKATIVDLPIASAWREQCMFSFSCRAASLRVSLPQLARNIATIVVWRDGTRHCAWRSEQEVAE
jgi:hypothetical protein